MTDKQKALEGLIYAAEAAINAMLDPVPVECRQGDDDTLRQHLSDEKVAAIAQLRAALNQARGW